jgi:D-alanine-D-alanine ligase
MNKSTYNLTRNNMIKCIVILPDIHKPYSVNPFYAFTEEDFHIIEVFKKALSSLKEFEFVYLDNHDTLLQDLYSIKEEFGSNILIFNQCDTGFNNYLQYELIKLAVSIFIWVKKI